jgi:hypothetical protein
MMQFQWKNEWTVPSVVGVISAGVGVGAGFLLGRHKYRNNEIIKIVKSPEKEVPEPETFELAADAAFEDLKEHVGENAYREIVRQVTHTEVVVSEPEEASKEPVVVNIFTEKDPNDTWDMEAEVTRREVNNELIYIIHAEEYAENERGFSTTTLTYYTGDDVLVDEKEVPIARHERMVGELKFGHGSKDDNVVFVCNEELEAFFEIIKDEGHYSVEVLGVEIEEELNHSHEPPLRFRKD